MLTVFASRMAYIEDEMRKRTGSADTVDAAALVAAVNDPEDALYAVAEKYKELHRSIKPEQTQEQREGNVAFSSAMLTSIPEVDLGIDARMANIQDTEAARREASQPKPAHHDVDEDFANARFQRAKPRQDHAQSSNPGSRPERRQMATDQLVLDRFKKRQRNFR